LLYSIEENIKHKNTKQKFFAKFFRNLFQFVIIIFMSPAFALRGIACCVTHLCVRNF